MAAVSLCSLPYEVSDIVVSKLLMRDLTSASTVSHLFNDLAFPYLYRVVYLSLMKHLELFERRLVNDKNRKLSPRFYTEKIVLSTPCIKRAHGEYPIPERDLHRIGSIMACLTKLWHFSWDLPYIPEYALLLDRLQDDFPSLRSVCWSIKDAEYELDFDSDQYHNYFKFQNLTQFTLLLDSIVPEFDQNHLGSIVTLMRSSPGLESFTLCLKNKCDFQAVASVLPLAEGLHDITFPSLHTFRVHGVVNPDWCGFFDQPASHPLRTFFARHPGLQTIGIGCVDETPYPTQVDPENLARLFPSLKHLEAPPFICGPVLSSKLSKQLQSLVVLYNDQVGYEPNLTIVAQAILPQPRLRRLAIHGDSSHMYSSIAVEPLKSILRVMPILEELVLHTWLEDYEQEELFDVLGLAPGLRILGIESNDMDAMVLHLGVANPVECLPAFLKVCPRLERIDLMVAYTAKHSWNIDRDLEGNLVFTSGILLSWPDLGAVL